MGFGNKYKDDDFEDIRRYEEYQRRKNEAVVKGVGGFIFNLIIKWFILLSSFMLIALAFMSLTELNEAVSMILTLIGAFLVFKIRYVKEHPFKSLFTIWFLIGLEFVVFYN